MNLSAALNWLGDRIVTLPVAIVVVTERCNSMCVSCDFWQNGTQDLPLERARWLAGELRKMKTTTVVLTGGEPLLHPQWDEVAEAMREDGRELWLLTAGLALGKESRRVAELCHRVTVSLDGATRETYRGIRGVDAFPAVCEAIRRLVALRVWVSVRVTVQKQNYRELPELVRLARNLGVNEVSFLAIDIHNTTAFMRRNGRSPSGALASEDLSLFAEVLASLERDFAADFASGFIAESPGKLRLLHQYFRALTGSGPFPPVRCNAPRFSAVIRPDGTLQPCYFIQGVRGLGGKNGASLVAHLNEPSLRGLRRDIRRGERKECERCVCSMWKSPTDLVLSNRQGRLE